MASDNKRYYVIESLLCFMIFGFFAIFAYLSYKDYNDFIVGLICFWLMIFAVKVVFFVIIHRNNVIIAKNQELYGLITDNIAGGCLEIKLDEELTIINMDSNFLKFTLYSSKEINQLFNNSLLRMIDENYWESVMDAFHNQTLKQSKSQIYYKLRCKDSCKGVINIFRIYIDAKGRKTAQNLLMEPSSFKQVQHERDLDSMRYKIVAEQSESIIFDFNPRDNSIYLNSHFERKFGYTIIGDLFDYVKEHNIVYKDDLDKFFKLSVDEKEYNETELRLKKSNNQYIWCKIRMTSIMGEGNKPSRLIGKIIDVDKSRREKIRLIEKTKRDLMTDMYNKLTTETLVDEAIEKNKKSLAAFLLIDIDNFKSINDNWGHMAGDYVLTKISVSIKSIFRSSDIIGRIGGDEFVVFIRDLYDENHAKKKALEILQNIRKLQNKNSERSVTVSIGVAFYDKDGSDYKQLYANADRALYKAKNKGKDTYEFHDANLEMSSKSL